MMRYIDADGYWGLRKNVFVLFFKYCLWETDKQPITVILTLRLFLRHPHVHSKYTEPHKWALVYYQCGIKNVYVKCKMNVYVNRYMYYKILWVINKTKEGFYKALWSSALGCLHTTVSGQTLLTAAPHLWQTQTQTWCITLQTKK